MPVRAACSGFAEIMAMYRYIAQSDVSTDEVCSARKAGISLAYFLSAKFQSDCG